jgi:hypothetical protein
MPGKEPGITLKKHFSLSLAGVKGLGLAENIGNLWTTTEL